MLACLIAFIIIKAKYTKTKIKIIKLINSKIIIRIIIIISLIKKSSEIELKLNYKSINE